MSGFEIGLLIGCFVLAICVFVSLLILGVAFFVTYKVVNVNFRYQDNIAAYKNYIAAVSETVSNSAEFLRAELFKRIGDADIPEYREAQRGLEEFRNQIFAIYQSSLQLSQDDVEEE